MDSLPLCHLGSSTSLYPLLLPSSFPKGCEVQLPILRVTCARSDSRTQFQHALQSAQVSTISPAPSALPPAFRSLLQVRVLDADTFPMLSKRPRDGVLTDVVLGPATPCERRVPRTKHCPRPDQQEASSSGSSHCAPAQSLGCTADLKRCSAGLWSSGRRARPRPRVKMQPRAQAQA